MENLRDGVATALDADAARDAWDGTRARPDRRARPLAPPPRAEVAAMKQARPARDLDAGHRRDRFLGTHLLRLLAAEPGGRRGAGAGAQRAARLAARAGGRDLPKARSPRPTT